MSDRASILTTEMHYPEDEAVKIELSWEGLLKHLRTLWVSLARDTAPSLRRDEAREHIGHGACRRLKLIEQCLHNIFSIFPVRRTQLLHDDERSNVEINLHAFLIHTHGLPDNLAWAFILERSLETKLIPTKVGLFEPATQQYFPNEVQEYLRSPGVSAWHKEYAKNYRDALAHRIPPYVPPSIFKPTHQREYEELHEQSGQAFKDGNFDLAFALEEKKHQIGLICPAFMHSFLDKEAQKPMVLHPQLVADTNTLIEIIDVIGPYLPA
jgi:hypothetical protein